MLGGRDATRAALYRQLAALEGSGITIRDALERVRSSALEPVRAKLGEGGSVGEAFAASSAITPIETRLVKAGEASGKLPEVFSTLAALFESRAAMKRRLAADLAYPFFLLHLAFVIPPVPHLVSGGLAAYARHALPPLLGLYGGTVVLVFLVRFLRASAPRLLDGFVRALPVIGPLSQARALSAALTALSAIYEAGVPIVAAVDAAAETSTSPYLSSALERIARRLEDGVPLGDAFASERAIPLAVQDAVRTGEKSGKLDTLLDAARRTIERDADAKREVILRLVPVLVFLAVASVIAWNVISFWAGYASKLGEAMR